MDENELYFYLEPFVHFAEGKTSILFYNTLSGSTFEIQATPLVKEIIDQWKNDENGYVASLESGVFQDQGAVDLFDNLRCYFMGDFWQSSWSSVRPFNLLPRAAFKHSIPPESENGLPMIDASNQHHFLRELTFCLNSHNLEEKPRLINGFRQILFPSPSTRDYMEMDFDLIRNVILSLDKYHLPQLSFTAFNPFRYTKWKELTRFLANLKTIRQFNLDLEELTEPGLLQLLKMSSTRIQIYHYPPFNRLSIKPGIVDLINRSRKIDLRLLVSDETDYLNTEQFVADCKIKRYTIKPNFLSESLTFFKKFVFLKKEEILASKPDQRQVLSRLTLNDLYYGMLVILPWGEVFANPNEPSLGDLQSDSINQLIEKEVLSGNSWTRTRSKVVPCNDCLYRFLCPPISGYELFTGKFNFCNVIADKTDTR